jgi:tRNA(Ile)-lysidine synthase
MSARAARQAFFARCCGTARLDAVATGHQADDVAETLVLRLARGAGGSGLAALRPRSPASPALARAAGRPFSFIRPLLPASGRALRAWLTRRGLTWCEDASYQSCDIPRNRVRNRLLPQLEAAWGESLRENLCRSADILREEDALLEALAARRLKTIGSGGEIDIPRLRRQPEPLQRRILRQWLFAHGEDKAAGFESVARLLGLCFGGEAARLQLPGGSHAVACDGRLTLRSRGAETNPEATLSLPGRTCWGGLEIIAEPHSGICSEAHGVGRYPAACSVDAAKLKGRVLTVRSRKPGDRLYPTGLDGSKKLLDVCVDAKVPEAQRDAIPVIACGEDVVWIPGYRVSRPFRVSAKDAPSLRITVQPTAPAPAAPTSKGLPGFSGL